MTRFIKENFILIVILAIAILLRFWQLTSVPPSLNWDEAALGYNAYSILTTGKDEYGKFFPLVFKSFGDFKPGIYVYLTVPFIAIFGLTEFAVRAPSAVFGVLAVLVLYFVVWELFNDKKLALISAAFLAISPWHLLISRPAFEANIALFLNLLGIYSFLKFIKEKSIFHFLIFHFAFLISIYTYQVSKLIIPVFLAGLLWFWFREIISLSKKYILITIIFLLLALPIYVSFLFGGTGGRFEVFSVFSYKRPEGEIAQLAKEDETSTKNLNFRLFHNEPYNYGRWILGNYLNHFSTRFLFFEGDFQNDRTKIPENGVMYFFDFVFLLFGFYAFFNNLKSPKKYFLLYWLAISPLPAVLTRDAVSPIRAVNQVVPVVIFASLGALYFLENFKRFKNFFWIYFMFSIFILWNILFFLDSYFVHYPKETSEGWVYGYKQVVEVIRENYNKFDQIVFTTAYNEPYIFTLFYTKYPPSKYQPQAELELIRGPKDVGEIKSFDKFRFRHVNYPGDLDLRNSLLIGAPNELPESELVDDLREGKVERIKDVNFLDGKPAFKVVAVK